MARPKVSIRLGLAGACGLLLLGGIAGAATVDEDSDDAKPGAAAVASNDTVPPVASGSDEVPGVAPVPAAPGGSTPATGGAPSTTVVGGATTTTAAPAGKASRPGALKVPKVGDYTYEATATSGAGNRTERTTTRVEAAGNEGATTIQVITLPLDLGGQQAVARNTVAWGTAGATVRRSLITVTSLGNAQLDCTWQPPFLEYAGGLAVGRSWSFTTRCAGKVQGFDVTIVQRATRKVTGTAQVAGPAGTVATWTIADDTTIELTSPLGNGTVRRVGTQQLAPSVGLPVRTESKVDARMTGSTPTQSTITTKLLTQP